MGKTALLEAAARRPDAGVVLRAGGVESEAQLPFAGLLDLLRPILHLRDALPAPQRAALAGALALGPPAPGDRFTVCVAVAELLARAGARERHLVVVDDLPWLDPPSREAVLYVARRVPAGVAVLIAAHAEVAAKLPPSLEAHVVAPLPDRAALLLLREHAPDLPADIAAEPPSGAASTRPSLTCSATTAPRGTSPPRPTHPTRCEQMAEISGLAEPHLVPWAPDLIETYVRSGRREEAARPLAWLEEAARTAGTATARALAARCRGLVAADGFDEHFLDALRHHDAAPTPFERARTQLAYGSRLQRDGRRREARTHLHAAAACFGELGAAPWPSRPGPSCAPPAASPRPQRGAHARGGAGRPRRRPRARSGRWRATRRCARTCWRTSGSTSTARAPRSPRCSPTTSRSGPSSSRARASSSTTRWPSACSSPSPSSATGST